MRYLSGLMLAGASTLLSGCLATQSQLKHASDQHSAQLAQANAALTTERAERAASDSALAQQLGMVSGDVQALRNDLQAMRTEFGAKITAMEDGLHFMMPVNFAFNGADVRDQDHPTLDRFATVVQKYYPGSKITIEGFADPAGTGGYNVQLSTRRAAVRQYRSQGLTTNRLSTVGDMARRVSSRRARHDEPGADLNRRVVFVIESRGQAPCRDGARRP